MIAVKHAWIGCRDISSSSFQRLGIKSAAIVLFHLRHSSVMHASSTEPLPYAATSTPTAIASLLDDVDLFGLHGLEPLSAVTLDQVLSEVDMTASDLLKFTYSEPFKPKLDCHDKTLPLVQLTAYDSSGAQVKFETLSTRSTTSADSWSSRRKLCSTEGCGRVVRSRGYCKKHGGGKPCMMEGCRKEAQNGSFCIGHGGGKCCKVDDCANAAQSQGLCKAHGGGARCKHYGCKKSSQGGGFCRAHGGGKRCMEPGCTKGAQRGDRCAKHGGCRSCSVQGCGRTDRGGGLCEIHRQDMTCSVDGCKRLGKTLGMCTVHVRQVRNSTGAP
ncbi:hypothetical protein H310_03657 [Aphanomyces invadans]|uniref:WRKY19-like zinc finger domain-containing protein n=1 Tax=Aphanomyces invadans TaxID=157072 RepID=A0A024UHZ7_9STRA|nr:hypothetical protein H310_03657 [Aphanomyces invadans]ETW06061.1 hypothetical protein H310_03657 [Aphanomyces invadans]|eukprot:XP_008865838.1 hypothetical protein H310_03657 [Aphanomyces invadans]